MAPDPAQATNGHTHAGVPDLLGAWVLDALDPVERAAVARHLEACPGCAAEAARLQEAWTWLGIQDPVPAPPGLRDAVLKRARARRPPALLVTLTNAYAHQVEQLGDELAVLAPSEWLLADRRHGDLRGLIAHLARNDAMLAADLGLDRPADGPPELLPDVPPHPTLDMPRLRADPAAAWSGQAEALLERLTAGPPERQLLQRPVRLATRGVPPIRPARDALVQRAFETWIHGEDVAAATGRSTSIPPSAQLRRIVDLAVSLLAMSLRAAGLARPGDGVRLILDGPGEGEWTVPVGHDEPVLHTSAEIHGAATGFARLVAGRQTPEAAGIETTGDTRLADEVLRVAATLGCD